MKKVIKTEETYVDVILADIPNKRIYVTQETMKRSILCISTVEMIKEYKDRYPTFKLEVNDAYIKKTLGFIPA